MQLLLDEHISPVLVTRLAEIGVYAQSVPHVGLMGCKDSEIWNFALQNNFIVVTTNARDFIHFLDTYVHPGLIVLRESGLSRQEQWIRLKPVVEYIAATGDPDFMLNKLIEIVGVDRFFIRDVTS